MVASRDSAPPDSLPVLSPTLTVPSVPAVKVQFPVPARLATVSTTKPTDSLPALQLPCVPALPPVGGHWPGWCIALAIQLVTAVKLSIRSIPRVFSVVFGLLTGHPLDNMMSWTTVRCWLMRLGLYALRRPLTQADDWAYLIDHTVQIGTMKCLAIVGIRLGEWPGRCLCHGDLCLVALVPMEHSTGATVRRALEEAEQRTGTPRLIVSDEGRDVQCGIDRYCQDHPRTVATCDAAHKGANQLRHLLEADERWAGFVAQLGQTKAKLQQTPLACCMGPRLRPKARFMNLAAPLRWSRWCLRLLDGALPQGKPLTERQQTVLAGIDRTELEAKLGWLREYRQAVEEWSQWHAVIQVVVRQVRRHGIDRDTVACLRRQFDDLELLPSAQDTAGAMIRFVEEQAWVARLGGERLIGSTEVLESIFGGWKDLQGQQSESGLTGLMLVLGALVSTWTPEEIKQALDATPWKAAQAWVEERVGVTVQAQRRTLQTIFSGA
jgi:hypothetical protein